jgi:hypothetical protein
MLSGRGSDSATGLYLESDIRLLLLPLGAI